MEEAQKKAANWKKQAAEAKKKAAKEMADAEAAQKKHEAELEAARAAAEAKQAAALKKQQETYAKAKAAAEAAHLAAEMDRKAKEAEQIAAHKKAMADRRAKFEQKFRNVWSTGATGASYMQMTTHDDPNELISKLFKGTMIADEWNVVSSVKRSYMSHGHQTYDSEAHHLTMITSDDRVAEAIETVAAWYDGSRQEGTPFDLVVTPLATGSKDYIEWVKLQTLKKDDETAFFNEQAKPAMKARTGRVDERRVQSEGTDGDIKDYARVQTGQSLWSSDPEEEED